MVFRLLGLLLVLMSAPSTAAAALPFAWPGGARAAIVLTYDDGLRSQLDVAVPHLDAAGLKGTFFLNGTLDSGDVARWRAAQAGGHELGNHSLFHPCPAASFPADPHYHAENYTVGAMLREIAVMNNLLFAIDGRTERTYSVPCSQALVGGEDYVDALRASGLVLAVRTGGTGNGIIADPAVLDPFRVPSRSFTEINDGADLIAFAEDVLRSDGMGVYMFHGVGGDYLAVSAEAHQALVRWLAARRGEIWVAPFGEVMKHIVERRSE
jgi:hypothetical protein